MLARITGKSFRAEASKRSTSYDLVANVRHRRMKWLGQILRGDSDRLVYRAVATQLEMGKHGNLLMDAPPRSIEELVALAKEDKGTVWREMTDALAPKQTTTTPTDRQNQTSVTLKL